MSLKKIQGTGASLCNYLANFRIGSQEEWVLFLGILPGIQVFSQELLSSNHRNLEALRGNNYLTC